MTGSIRVFARKTSMTPKDDFAFYGEPPLFHLPDLPVHVSVTFTWDIERGERLAKAWSLKTSDVHLGGPAFGEKPGQFTPGRFLKPGITITSRGCPKHCPWCLVAREGRLRQLIIKPGHIIQDNNILACSRRHFEKVCEMLSQQKKAAQFKGGLDVDYLTAWHVDQLKKIRVSELWVAADSNAAVSKLDKAADLLGDYSIAKKRCYVLIGFDGDTPSLAKSRCRAVYSRGFLPFAQYYRPSGGWITIPNEWRFAVRKWARPAAYRAKKEG